MEYVQGDSLAKMIEWIGIGNSLQWKEVFVVAAQIGRALHEAEKRKIIHRNVTPNNILRRSKDSCHLLGDLMLAKALEGTQAREITKPGQIVGELPYLPPERTYPNATVDERSDLYGLGATLYGLITGKAPGTGKNPVEIIQNIRSKEPMKPSLFQKDINREFEEAVMRWIAKSPEDWYPEQSLAADRPATYRRATQTRHGLGRLGRMNLPLQACPAFAAAKRKRWSFRGNPAKIGPWRGCMPKTGLPSGVTHGRPALPMESVGALPPK